MAANIRNKNFHATNEKSRHGVNFGGGLKGFIQVKPRSDHYVYPLFPVHWIGVYGRRANQGHVLIAAVSTPPHDS